MRPGFAVLFLCALLLPVPVLSQVGYEKTFSSFIFDMKSSITL